MDMNFKQYYHSTNLTTDIYNTNDSNQYTENEQTQFDKSSTNVIVSNHIKEYVPSAIISSTIPSSTISPIRTCNSNYDTINNNTETKMKTVTNSLRITTTNPIFNFWRNSTRRSGNWGSRTGTKKSFVWKYFFHPELHLGTKDLTHTQCILCDSLLAFNNSGTTTTMLNHLKSRHAEIVQQEYQQSKKSRCGLMTLKEMNKLTKLNYNLTSNNTKLIDWRTHRGRPPGSHRYFDYSVANPKFNHIDNDNNNINYLMKIHNSNINKYGEKEVMKENEEMNQLQTQIKVDTCSPSYTLGNEKETNTDKTTDNTGYNKSFSMIPMDNESINQHQGLEEEFQLLNQKTDESIPSSSPYFINDYPLSCFSPSCEEFHYRLAYFLIRDFHPPKILEEEGFKINEIQTLNEILKPCWNLIYSQFNTNYDLILSEWPIIILTNCSEYTLNAFKESCPISNYLILPCFNVYMKNAVQCALRIPAIDQVLNNYQKSLETLDENIQQMEDLSSESNPKCQSNDKTNINESLSDILNLITRIISNMDRLPHFTDVDMNLINRIFKSIEISILDNYVQKIGINRKMTYMEEFQYSINDYINEKSIDINENPIQWWNDQWIRDDFMDKNETKDFY
ncbi:hypothetical protein Smp_157870 [Schistosoma mansoni]|uniref:hypothetical protein n=1 Tax=Schistosoma mansoni TaxID=6183 RepID=UPI00022DCA19|nr:hypothetical protein Smp_157870 [Schistosoma mansoni]|eukprot:XP_018654896.1 hypothetical protein Smp_157870 [Schistosoma mansoni]